MNLSRFSLEGKVALVTGGSRGIGRASALALVDAGAHVVVSSRKIADLEAVAEEIRAKGVRALAVAAHNAKIEESRMLIERVVKEFGRIDILMNNAGTNPYYGPLLEQDEKTYQEQGKTEPPLISPVVPRVHVALSYTIHISSFK